MIKDNHFCEHIENHDNHICQLVSKAAMGEIIELVDLPGFICQNCARVANSAQHLCRPRNLDEASEQ